MANEFKNATKTGLAVDSGTYDTVYTASATGAGKHCILLELDIANTHSSDITTSVKVDPTTGDTVHIVKDAPVPVGGALKVISGQKIVLEPGDAVLCASSVASVSDCILSVLESVNSGDA